MAIANNQILSVIVSLQQCEKAFKFLKSLKEIFAAYPQLIEHVPQMCDFQYDDHVASFSGYPYSALLFIHGYRRALKSALAAIGLSEYEITWELCKDHVDATDDADVRRMVIEGAFAECATRFVEFEPRADAEARGIDCFRICEVEIVEEMVPHYFDEEELVKSIVEADSKKIVCDAFKELVMTSVVSAPAHYKTRTMESLKSFVANFDMTSSDSLRNFESLCFEVSAAKVASRQIAAQSKAEARRDYKPSQANLRDVWKPSERLMEAAKRAAHHHRRGLSVNDACARERLSSATYYAAMHHLAKVAKD